MALCKMLVRTAVIGGLATGGVVLVAGPQRAAAMFHQAKHAAVSVIDDNIDDPAVLRQQLQKMKSEYPDRIAKIWGEVTALEGQIAKLERNRAVALGVAQVASEDYTRLTGLIDQGEAVRADEPYRVVNIRFNHGTMPLDAAYHKGTELQQIINVNREAAHDAERELSFMHDQHNQLVELHAQLKAEQAKVEAQIVRLDAQIDSIERNEKMIELVEQRQKTLDELGRFESVSLDQFNAKLDQIRAEQEAKLDGLRTAKSQNDYEAQVRARVESELRSKERFEAGKELIELDEIDAPIEVTPDGVKDRATTPVAMGEPIVIR